MFHLQPLMFLGLFPLFAIFEGTLGLLSLGTIEQRIQHYHSELSTVLATEAAWIRGCLDPELSPSPESVVWEETDTQND